MAKILFVIPDLYGRVTGANKRAIALAKELSKMHSVVVFSKKKILYIDSEAGNTILNTSFTSILRVLTKNRFNYWFCDTIFYAIFPIPNLIFTLHDMKEWTEYGRNGFIKKIVLHLILKRSKYLITVSENQREIIKRILHNESLVFKNAVSQEWLDFPLATITDNLVEKEKYVLYVSNLAKHKGHNDILKNTDILSEYKIIFIGTPIDKEGVLIKRDIENTDGCFIYSNVGELELINWVSNASFILFPSYYEGFGMPILESIALKKRVLINKELDLDHFKSCSNIRRVSFSDGLTSDDIKWSELDVDYCDKCNCKYGWSYIAEEVNASILQ